MSISLNDSAGKYEIRFGSRPTFQLSFTRYYELFTSILGLSHSTAASILGPKLFLSVVQINDEFRVVCSQIQGVIEKFAERNFMRKNVVRGLILIWWPHFRSFTQIPSWILMLHQLDLMFPLGGTWNCFRKFRTLFPLSCGLVISFEHSRGNVL